LFEVKRDNLIIDYCDLIAAEEIAANAEHEQYIVKWVYPEDRENRNA
jgi:hypothetical protein